MFDWYNVVDDSEIQELAGFTEKNLDVLEDGVRNLVEIARRNGIPLEAIQILIGKAWKVKMEGKNFFWAFYEKRTHNESL